MTQMPQFARESIRRMLVNAAYLWISWHVSENHKRPSDAKFESWIYEYDLNGMIERGKRLRVTIQLEDSDDEVPYANR